MNKDSVLIRPTTPISETVAEIRSDGQKLHVVFPEKRDDFRRTIKRMLFTWSGTHWERVVTFRVGDPVDRMAEIAHRLLAAGFCICMQDVVAKDRLIAGSYTLEQTRWVATKATGDHTGWFVILWNKRIEDMYVQARKLPGSRYADKEVVVPPSQFEEVLGFAEVYGFSLSPGAQRIVSEQQEARAQALVLDVPPVPEKHSQNAEPPILAVPTTVEVDPDLLDRDIGCAC
ncbi:MAG: hypothetical protein PHV85_00155 [Desulfovibrionaceae bacterium]|nr:hypothetical protein [Desulfovibrionaceae bacterium]